MQKKDMDDIIEALTLAVVRQETEEKFFRRSAEKSTTDDAKALFLEIARDFQRYRERLEVKKRGVVEARRLLK
jgi:rubrerythrin